MEQNSDIKTEIKNTLDLQKTIEESENRILECELRFRQLSVELSTFERLVNGCFSGFSSEPISPAVETHVTQNPAKKTPTHPINSILPNTLMNFESADQNTGNNLDVQWESLADEINSQSKEIDERVGTIIRSVRIKGPARL